MVDLISQSCFCFIEISIEGLGISGVIGLVIDRTVLMEIDVAVGFFGLFLW